MKILATLEILRGLQANDSIGLKWTQLNSRSYDQSLLRPAGCTGSFLSATYKSSLDGPARGVTANFPRWTSLETGGPIIVPYFVHQSVGHFGGLIRNSLKSLEEDLGCFAITEISNEEIGTIATKAKYKNGVVFIKNVGCFSSVGVDPGQHHNTTTQVNGVYNSITEFGVPEGWQVISLDGTLDQPDCTGKSPGTVQHEMLHALGVFHEHQRPDVDLMINYDRTSLPKNHFNYRPLKHSEWFDMSSPFEVESVMTYCSRCFPGETQPVLSLKGTGEEFGMAYRVTTTDAMQIHHTYCKTDPEIGKIFSPKQTIECKSKDKLGFSRKIFADRLCDNIPDCGGFEDEISDDRALTKCKLLQPNTEKGCCGAINFFNPRTGPLKCIIDGGQYNNRDFWKCDDGGAIAYLDGRWAKFNHWPINEYDNYESFIISDATCPPINERWKKWFPVGNQWSLRPNEFSLCFWDGTDDPNQCDEKPCDENAICTDLHETYNCKCNEFYTGDGKTCTFIPEIDECSDGTHKCDVNANCTDNRYDYTCQCKDGFKDNVEGDAPGRSCVAEDTCCDLIEAKMWSSKPPGKSITCTRHVTKTIYGRPVWDCDENDFTIQFEPQFDKFILFDNEKFLTDSCVSCKKYSTSVTTTTEKPTTTKTTTTTKQTTKTTTTKPKTTTTTKATTKTTTTKPKTTTTTKATTKTTTTQPKTTTTTKATTKTATTQEKTTTTDEVPTTTTTTTTTTSDEETTTTTARCTAHDRGHCFADPCDCTDDVIDGIIASEKSFISRKAMVPLYLGNNGFVVQATTKGATRKDQSYLQCWVMSRAVCGQPVLDYLHSHDYDFTVMEKRAKGQKGAITNYAAFNGTYYRENDPSESKKTRSVTLGFRADKTVKDTSGKWDKDVYYAGIHFNKPLPDTITIDDVYNCFVGAKPVTIKPGKGIDMTCDYTKCVGEQVKVGF
ncbi:Oidioi.mRNA.OKI2018_I69.chr1.g1556.t1.cds [Oikopleura dioica]|uniref:Metalloendopeptidase n=1 Tax=Oikopleura dioica TaxID=34765 RepID=A0ABN7SNA5_OIKDI|nr:Oidioi.mRNA.OKI2018_I69.chr1.g1556.t1.cds [Oikopleura dioica]